MQPHEARANLHVGALMAGLVAKPGAMKSPVWEHFGFEGNESGILCIRVSFRQWACRFHYLPHLQNAHPAIYHRMKGDEGSLEAKATAGDGQQQTLEDATAKSTPYTRNTKGWKKLANAVTYRIAKDVFLLCLLPI